MTGDWIYFVAIGLIILGIFILLYAPAMIRKLKRRRTRRIMTKIYNKKMEAQNE